MLRIILEIYIGISLFSAGFMLGQADRNLISIIIYLFFGPFLIIGEILKMWLKSLASIFQIKFFWQFFVLRMFKNETTERLEDFNSSTKKYKNSKSLRDRVWRLCTRLINKRNNYSSSNEKP